MSIRRNQLAVAACAGLLVLTLLWGNRSDSPSSSRSAKTASSRKATTPEWSCNPFEANGRLQYDPDVQENNVWVPFDSRCKPSNMMSDLASSHGKRSATALPWFANRTIVIHSDSIDRYHLRDFCDFVGGKLTNINPEHPASPPMYRDPAADAERRKLEDQWSKRPTEGWELTTPWVCDVQRYGATLVNVFTFGLEGAESFFQSERWYYPPGESSALSHRERLASELTLGPRPSQNPHPLRATRFFLSPMGRPARRDHAPLAAQNRLALQAAADCLSRSCCSELGLLGLAPVHGG